MLKEQEEMLKQFVYKIMNNTDYISYYCSYQKNNKEQVGCSFSKKKLEPYDKSDRLDNTEITYIFTDGVCSGYGNNNPYYLATTMKTGYSNIPNVYYTEDLLLNTNYYIEQETKELKMIISENGNSGTRPEEITTISLVLWTIAFVIVLGFIYGFLRKLFFNDF